jgi:hypothetical protein
MRARSFLQSLLCHIGRSASAMARRTEPCAGIAMADIEAAVAIERHRRSGLIPVPRQEKDISVGLLFAPQSA